MWRSFLGFEALSVLILTCFGAVRFLVSSYFDLWGALKFCVSLFSICEGFVYSNSRLGCMGAASTRHGAWKAYFAAPSVGGPTVRRKNTVARPKILQ